MARDKAKDEKFFNCSEDYEIDYVAAQYANKQKVKDFIILKCKAGVIKYMTHKQLYELIQKELGYSIPV